MTEKMTRRERRAAERANRGSGGSTEAASRSPFVWVVGGLIAVVIVAVVAVLALGGGGGDDGLPPVVAVAAVAPEDVPRDGRSIGDPDAPVTIEVFEDPQCPACAQFTARIEPLLIAGPVRDGDVYLTYRDLTFLGPESEAAAAAMRVAEALGGKFWEYHDVVFGNQLRSNQGGFSSSRLAQMAELVGIDKDEFLDELGEPGYIEAVREEKAIADSLGIGSTPTLVINGVPRPGVPSWEELSAIIEAELPTA
jgi:protein-disulfide isomerase